MVNTYTKFIQFVEILCKPFRKTTWKSIVNLRAKLKSFIQHVEIVTFPPTFPALSTTFPTITFNLSPPELFHLFTTPTITIIN